MALTPFSAKFAMSASVTKVSRCNTTAARSAAVTPPAVQKHHRSGTSAQTSQACRVNPDTS